MKRQLEYILKVQVCKLGRSRGLAYKRRPQILDHCYTAFRNTFKPLARPALGKSHHCSIPLLHKYKQQLKQDKPVPSAVQQWGAKSNSILQNCFEPIVQKMFQDTVDGNINKLTDSVTGYVHKCIDDVASTINIRPFPNEKPWVGGEVCAKLSAQTAAYNSGDPDAYKDTRYDLHKSIRAAKMKYLEKVESNYHGSNLGCMWRELQYITLFLTTNNGGVYVSIHLSAQTCNTHLSLDHLRLWPKYRSEVWPKSGHIQNIIWTL